MRVVDLFCGLRSLGGMTCGALEAGAEVVLAVDSDPVPLKTLGANAPQSANDHHRRHVGRRARLSLLPTGDFGELVSLTTSSQGVPWSDRG